MTTIKRYELKNVKIEGHRGTWYNVTDGLTFNINGVDTEIFLFEHEKYGFEAPHVIATADGKLFMENVWNGWADWKEFCLDEQDDTSKLVINEVISI